jgi:hypothetical protein
MSTVRAKFYVSKLVNPEGATAAEVGLNAVCRGVENALWSQATPAGSIQMYVKNDPAFEQFEQGAEYEVTFRKVSKPMPGDGHEIIEAVNMHGGIVCETCGIQLGYTSEAVEKQSYLKQYVTEEKLAEMRANHDEMFAKRG